MVKQSTEQSLGCLAGPLVSCLPKLLTEFLSLFFLFNLVGFSVANVLVNVAAARGKKHKQSKNRLWETDKSSKRWSLLPVVQLMASHRAAQI